MLHSMQVVLWYRDGVGITFDDKFCHFSLISMWDAVASDMQAVKLLQENLTVLDWYID